MLLSCRCLKSRRPKYHPGIWARATRLCPQSTWEGRCPSLTRQSRLSMVNRSTGQLPRYGSCVGRCVKHLWERLICMRLVSKSTKSIVRHRTSLNSNSNSIWNQNIPIVCDIVVVVVIVVESSPKHLLSKRLMYTCIHVPSFL